MPQLPGIDGDFLLARDQQAIESDAGIVQGRGWLSTALTFFGGWQPHLIFFGSFFFSIVEVFSLRAQVFGAGLPHQVLFTSPYIATLVVMMFGSRWTRTPGFLGQNYDREKRSV